VDGINEALHAEERVRLTVRATNGAQRAPLYELRVYKQAA